MKVYYSQLSDKIFLVTIYPGSFTYFYRTSEDTFYTHYLSPKEAGLVYIGEFYSGDLYEME